MEHCHHKFLCRSTSHGWNKIYIQQGSTKAKCCTEQYLLLLARAMCVLICFRLSSVGYHRLSVVCRYYCKHVRHSSANQIAISSTPPCVQGERWRTCLFLDERGGGGAVPLYTKYILCITRPHVANKCIIYMLIVNFTKDYIIKVIYI